MALIDASIESFGGAPGAVRSVAGRTVVVHSGRTRVACGVIVPYAHGQADVVHVARYPGYEGALDEATIREQLEGNLCRCTGYHNIVKAIAAASETMAAAGKTDPASA